MKKSELKQIIREELQKLNEGSRSSIIIPNIYKTGVKRYLNKLNLKDGNEYDFGVSGNSTVIDIDIKYKDKLVNILKKNRVPLKLEGVLNEDAKPSKDAAKKIKGMVKLPAKQFHRTNDYIYYSKKTGKWWFIDFEGDLMEIRNKYYLKDIKKYIEQNDIVLESIKEAADPILTKIGKIAKTKPLVQMGDDLDALFGEKNVSASYSPQFHFRIKYKGKTIMVINKKYVDDAELIVSDKAIGYL